jgi:hypothetical protein
MNIYFEYLFYMLIMKNIKLLLSFMGLVTDIININSVIFIMR